MDVGYGVSDRAEIANAYRRAGLRVVGDDDGRVVGSLENLIVVIDLPAMLTVVEASLGTVGVGGCKRGANRFETDAIVRELHRVEFDAHCGLRAAADKDLADALDLRDLLGEDGVGHVVDLGLGNDVGGERENEDRRLSRVGLAVAGILRQIRR